MRKYALVCALGVMLYATSGLADVRTVETTEKAITPIYLSLGRSTVLRFKERPKKVVLGNQNYFNVEFIENDLAIQPLGVVNTNLFVYGETHKYGFSLRVSGTSSADDLVHVAWWSPKGEKGPSEAVQVTNLATTLRLSPHLQMRLENVLHLESQSLMWIEALLLTNEKESSFSTADVDVTFFDKSGSELKIGFVCKDESIEPFEENACRIFFPPSLGKGFLLKVKFKDQLSQITF